MSILVIADHNEKFLSEQTARTITAAKKIGSEIHLLITGKNAYNIAEQSSNLFDIQKILIAENANFSHKLAEPLSSLILSIAKNYNTIIAPSNSNGKNVLPRVAALLNVMQISDVIEIVSPDTFKRPIYAGNAIQTIQTTDYCKIITIRTDCFTPALEKGKSALIENITSFKDPKLSSFIKEDLIVSGRPELTSAKIVISGGRALGSAENFQKIIFPLADKLNAAVGATRAAVDAGYAPNDWQVGQTGKIVSPQLYIAIGISGAIQHLAGMKESKTIISINKDENAPIFKISDYFIVGDLFEIVPKLEKML
ncbi:Electron transfer flavoprotein, alpha subunit [Liberibacter crescens BT-1]|uniref:Electron transfer flavoprotein subunit alpha n=1 Tax=Liberibacter crescens (strain BT-1) TaxID=1215343 RepID=L0ETP2_LIBCB|nr:electron transfer flavoprotein subunit alpha/FixB family protein [Liberibacter crescens]AGA64205.1 Electron transfer flavoprotein, alpha subunit [Liberibacter crescens BT-1]AMC12457.1 electron transfer flavoprotein subunit beta [Liberibacter crescens]